MRITTTKILKVEVIFERSVWNDGEIIVLIKTEKDERALPFRYHEGNIEAWQLKNIFALVGVTTTRSNELEGRTIDVVLDKQEKIVGYGTKEKDFFFLIQDPKKNLYTARQLCKMEKNNHFFMTRRII